MTEHCFNKMLLVIMLLGGCEISNPSRELPPPMRSDGLIPFATGNRWLYEFLGGEDSLGVQHFVSIESTLVIGDTVIASERWFWTTKGAGQLLQTNRSDGVYVHVGTSPCKLWTTQVGTSARFNVSDTIFGPTSFKLIDANSLVRTPAGEYRAYKYAEILERYSDTLTMTYLVPHLGMVKQDRLVGTKISWSFNLVAADLH